MTLRNSLALATALPLALAAAALVIPAAPANAQGNPTGMEEVQDEGSAYRAWFQANQAGDIAKAIEAASAYLAKYPSGQYVQYLTGWLVNAKKVAAFEAAIKEKRADDVVTAGQELLKDDAENLSVVYRIALFGAPASSVEFAKKGIALVEAGKTLNGVDKNGMLARLTQVLAVDAQKNGTPAEAIKLYEQSTALAPQDPQVAGKNLWAVYGLRNASYAEAAKAWNAIPEPDRAAADPKPEVKAARDRMKQEADAFVDSGAAFVAFAEAKNIAQAARDKASQAIEMVYKSQHPEDATAAGLQKLLQDKEAALGVAPAAPGN